MNGSKQVECKVPGCNEKFEQDVARFKLKESKQNVCRADHHWVCQDCAARFDSKKTLCDTCGHRKSITTIKVARSVGRFPDPIFADASSKKD